MIKILIDQAQAKKKKLINFKYLFSELILDYYIILATAFLVKVSLTIYFNHFRFLNGVNRLTDQEQMMEENLS